MNESLSNQYKKRIVHPYTLSHGGKQDIIFNIPEDRELPEALRNTFLNAVKYPSTYPQESRFNKKNGVRTYHILGTPYLINEYDETDDLTQIADIKEIQKFTSFPEATIQAPVFCGKFSCDGKLYTILRADSPLSNKIRHGIYKGVIVDPFGYQHKQVRKMHSTTQEVSEVLLSEPKYHKQSKIISWCAKDVFQVDLIIDKELLVLVDLLMDAYHTHDLITLGWVREQFSIYLEMHRPDFMKSLANYLTETEHIEKNNLKASINYRMGEFFDALQTQLEYIP